MTIKQYAEQKGVSPQAVYQRLKKNKIKVESLTEKGTGEITGEGMVILDKLFDPENRQTKPIKDERIEALEKQLAEARADLARKDEKVESLKKEIEKRSEDSKFWQEAFLKEQELHLQILKVLPAANEAQQGETATKPASVNRKLTWRERFTGRVDSKKK